MNTHLCMTLFFLLFRNKDICFHELRAVSCKDTFIRFSNILHSTFEMIRFWNSVTQNSLFLICIILR